MQYSNVEKDLSIVFFSKTNSLAYDADLTKRAFDVDSGIKFYEKILEINQSPYIRHQYALFLQRKNLYDPAWKHPV